MAAARPSLPTISVTCPQRQNTVWFFPFAMKHFLFSSFRLTWCLCNDFRLHPQSFDRSIRNISITISCEIYSIYQDHWGQKNKNGREREWERKRKSFINDDYLWCCLSFNCMSFLDFRLNKKKTNHTNALSIDYSDDIFYEWSRAIVAIRSFLTVSDPSPYFNASSIWYSLNWSSSHIISMSSKRRCNEAI